MAGFTKVAQVGAAGSLGSAVLKELVDSGLNVTVLSRTAGKIPAGLSSKVKEVVVDFTSQSALEEALQGQEAVVSTMGSKAIDAQKVVIKAAAAAGVKRFIPSEFGSDLQNPIARKLPVYRDKVQVEELLESLAAEGKMAYTVVFNNLFLDWGLKVGFVADVRGKKATLYNGGTAPISFSRLSTVGKAVVAVLERPEATENKYLRIHDGKLPKKALIQAVQEVTGAEGWTIEEESGEALQAKSDKALRSGVREPWVFLGYILRASQDEALGAALQPLQNDLLGLKEHSEEEMKEIIKDITKKIVGK